MNVTATSRLCVLFAPEEGSRDEDEPKEGLGIPTHEYSSLSS